MADDRDTTNVRDAAAGIDAGRLLNRARAALREAAEHLEDAAAASEHPSLNLAAALSQVSAARKAIRAHGFAEAGDASAMDAA